MSGPTKFRHNIAVDGTTIQQSMTRDPDHHVFTNNMTRFMVGVILQVLPADEGTLNRSAIIKKDSRGGFATADVLIVDDNSSSYLTLSNVIIPPSAPSGIDGYCERLPRPSFFSTTGEPYEGTLAGIDPNQLDGDWCIVGFLSGTIDRPFIVSWWPHSANVFDPATGGFGNPDSDGNGTTLDQVSKTNDRAHFGRFFQRINGVEYVISRRGDIYLSTHFTNSKLQHGTAEPTFGRYARQLQETSGGSIKVDIKPSQTLELSWNPYVDGIGVRGEPDPDLPQENPRSTDPSEEDRENTYILVDQSSIEIEVPDRLVITSVGTVEIEAGESVVIDSDDVTIGGSSGGNTLIDSRLASDWQSNLSSVLAATTGSPSQNALAIEAIKTFLQSIGQALNNDQTQNTKAL